MPHACEAPLPIENKGVSLECGYRVERLVEGAWLIELKSVQSFEPSPIFVSFVLFVVKMTYGRQRRFAPRQAWTIAPRSRLRHCP